MFTLIIGTRFVGEFSSPADFNFSHVYICYKCGEPYARRIKANAYYLSHMGVCLDCAKKYKHRDTFQTFRNPKEIDINWSPIPILAEELLFNLIREPFYDNSAET